MSVSTAAPTATCEAIVMRLVDRFNARDLEGMLACLHPEVELHPLKLGGLDGACRGHDGVRRWFARLRLEYLIDLHDVRVRWDGQVVALGSVGLGQGPIAPFGAVHRLAGGLILTTREYLSDPELLRIRGVIT